MTQSLGAPLLRLDVLLSGFSKCLHQSEPAPLATVGHCVLGSCQTRACRRIGDVDVLSYVQGTYNQGEEMRAPR